MRFRRQGHGPSVFGNMSNLSVSRYLALADDDPNIEIEDLPGPSRGIRIRDSTGPEGWALIIQFS